MCSIDAWTCNALLLNKGGLADLPHSRLHGFVVGHIRGRNRLFVKKVLSGHAFDLRRRSQVYGSFRAAFRAAAKQAGNGHEEFTKEAVVAPAEISSYFEEDEDDEYDEGGRSESTGY